ncbi:MAG: peptidoglycan editing factor PgeF [Gammaproteobacteria bacterium]|nr:peptidoglycan editing factor PgeF [Gammaproteobacteria bacterium]
MNGAPHCLQVDWPAPAHVRAAFSSRRGGVSEGAYASLNLGNHVGDRPAAVTANRAALARHLGLREEPCWLQQVHSDILLDLDDAASPRRGDAAITTTVGRVATVMVADCLPVLLCDASGRQVAAVHAGWRGLACELIARTVAAFDAPPSALHAWLGPAIGAAAYAVGDDLRTRFVALDARNAAGFAQHDGRWHMSLARIAELQLTALGVGSVSHSGICVHSDAQQWFSYRRDGETGRMAAMIWIEGRA